MRTVIMGVSAGGFTVLNALAEYPHIFKVSCHNKIRQRHQNKNNERSSKQETSQYKLRVFLFVKIQKSISKKVLILDDFVFFC